MAETPINDYTPILLAKAQNAITAWQSNLLDLSRNNRLLKFRTTSASTVPLILPDLATIFEWLVLEELKLPLHATLADSVPSQPSAVTENLNEMVELSPIKPVLTSSLNPERLGNALYTLRQRARSSIEERGVNVLYIALGFATWTDSPENGEWCAPLVLVPVALDRTSRARYVISLWDEDVVLNPTLVYKLEREYGIRLPEYPEDLDGLHIEDLFLQLSQAMQDLKGVTIKREAYLGLFSFLKIPMYRDLARHTDLILGHPLVARLAGLPTDEGAIIPHGIPSELDRVLDPRTTFQIMDADSSQQEALYAARQGSHLLIQGPPGTGKSQTITNLIGECLAEGKKVLFVSEKAAALEVVKRNLDQCGIGEACLELHSHKADKKKILADLQRVFEAPPPDMPANALDKQNAVVEVRDILNGYVRSLHQPRLALNKSVFEVYSFFERVRAAPHIELGVPHIENLTESVLSKQCACLETLAAHAQIINALPAHPWRGLIKRAPSLAFINEIRVHLESLRHTTQDLIQAIEVFRQLTGLIWPPHLSQLKELSGFLGKYQLGILKLAASDWCRRFNQTYHPWWRFLYPAYWHDLRQFKLLCCPGWKPSYPVIKADLASLEKYQAILGVAQEFAEEPAATLVQRIGQFLACLEPDLAYLGALFENAQIAPLKDECELAQIIAWCDHRLATLNQVDDYLLYRHNYEQAEAAGLGKFMAEATRAHIEATEWSRAYQRTVYTSWLDSALGQIPELGFFSRAEHDKCIYQFRQLDREQIRLARETIAARLAAERPRTTDLIQRAPSAELNILIKEFKKQRRVKALRKLFSEASQVIQALKPCFMMSPMAVSQYLDPRRFHFDVVVFDEASQVRVEDAIGCIWRGKQLVVAGDSKQLPPSRFFDALTSDEDWDEETEDDSDVYESILDALGTIPDLVLNRMLFWHYRSRHEALIAYSNKNFYDNRLFTFPHPEQAGTNKPIEFVYVPDGVYERGTSRKNVIEARRVVDLIIQHAQEHPSWSLAVVTFSDPQREAIQYELEQRLESYPTLKYFFDDNGKDEPFRIKNLELIQGDERDVILFSIGYGRDGMGRMPSMNFGPLNKSGGRRRLNVVVTRARQRVLVVSSMQPEELARSDNANVRLLREYMLLARDGLKSLVSPLTSCDLNKSVSSLEMAVYDRLTAAGLTVHRLVGCSDYRLDLAVVDPQMPSRYCLAIECDGANYRLARTARDRDRLRQQILENLGWRIHRIWSRDWNTNPERETQRVLDLVQMHADGSPQPDTLLPPDPSTYDLKSQLALDQPGEQEALAPVSAWRPNGTDAIYYDSYQEKLHSKIDHLRSIADDIVNMLRACGPLHRDALIDPLVTAWGYRRSSKRVREIIGRGILYAQSRNQVRVDHAEQFVYLIGSEPIKVRVPRPGTEPRPIEEICPEEIETAIQLCLKEAGGSVSRYDLVRLVVMMYGYQRAGTKITQPVQSVLTQMVDKNMVIAEEAIIRIAESLK